MFNCEILADSISPNGIRLTTMKVSFPRMILAEFNTHRMLSRNAASSRAIPNKRLSEMVMNDPFMPEFRLNQKGMQAGEMLQATDAFKARELWQTARNQMLEICESLRGLNIHKQYVNRLLEPWMFCEVIVSATDWDNFFHLRCHPDAEPSFQIIANMMREEMEKSAPKQIGWGEWHLPMSHNYLTIDDLEELFIGVKESLVLEELFIGVKESLVEKCSQELIDKYTLDEFQKFWQQDISVGRCTKVCYHNLDTGKIDLANDIRLAFQMRNSNPGHWSPFEHVATPIKPNLHYDTVENKSIPIEIDYCGNFKGWKQYRKFFENENYTKTT